MFHDLQLFIPLHVFIVLQNFIHRVCVLPAVAAYTPVETSGNTTHWPTWSFHYIHSKETEPSESALCITGRCKVSIPPVCSTAQPGFSSCSVPRSCDAFDCDFSSQHTPSYHLLQIMPLSLALTPLALTPLRAQSLRCTVPALQVCCPCLCLCWWRTAMRCCHTRCPSACWSWELWRRLQFRRPAASFQHNLLVLSMGKQCGRDALWFVNPMIYSALDGWSLTHFPWRRASDIVEGAVCRGHICLYVPGSPFSAQSISLCFALAFSNIIK